MTEDCGLWSVWLLTTEEEKYMNVDKPYKSTETRLMVEFHLSFLFHKSRIAVMFL